METETQLSKLLAKLSETSNPDRVLGRSTKTFVDSVVTLFLTLKQKSGAEGLA